MTEPTEGNDATPVEGGTEAPGMRGSRVAGEAPDDADTVDTRGGRQGTAPVTRVLRREREQDGFRRALGLTFLGTVIPGAGLTRTRSSWAGWALVAITVCVLSVGGYYLATLGPTRAALTLVSRPDLLGWIVIGLVVGGLLWCGSIVLTAILSRPRQLDRTRTRILAGFTTLMVLAVAASSFKATQYTNITQTTVKEVFKALPQITPGGGAQIVEGEDPWAQTPRVNLLLIGSDAGVGRIGTRTDSMIVASIDTKTGRTVLVQLPRNLEKVPLATTSPLRSRYPSGRFGDPNYTCAQGLHECMLTNLWQEAEDYKADNPSSYAGVESPGRTENRASIELATGLEIDHEVIIDLKGFEQLIDAMGGIDINVKLSGFGTKLPIGGKSDGNGNIIGESGYFEPGRQHLGGNLALWYARTRAADSDSFRQARQRCVVQAILQQVDPAAMLGKYPDLARIAQNNIYTDIPAANLPAYVELVERMQGGAITSVPLTAKEGINGGNPDYDLIRELIDKAINPPVTPSPLPSTATPKPSTTVKPSTPSASPTVPYEQC